MTITTFVRTFLLSVALVFLSACASNVTKTNQLAPGMTAAQVKESMGEPSQTQFISNKWVWKYSLHQPWVGFIPYYLVFDKDTQTLQQWYADQAEYRAQQELWTKAAASMPTYSPPPAQAQRDAEKMVTFPSRNKRKCVTTKDYGQLETTCQDSLY